MLLSILRFAYARCQKPSLPSLVDSLGHRLLWKCSVGAKASYIPYWVALWGVGRVIGAVER